MLERIFVDNYKSLINFEISLSENNLFVGKNGSGKGSLFYLLYCLRHVINGSCVGDYFPIREKSLWSTSPVQTIELDYRIDDSLYRYHLEIEFFHDDGTSKDSCCIKNEWVKCDGNYLIKTNSGKIEFYNDSYEKVKDIYVKWDYSALGIIHERHGENMKLISFKKAFDKLIICSPIFEHMHGSITQYDISHHYEEKFPDFEFKNLGKVFSVALEEFPDSIDIFFNELKHVIKNFSRMYFQGNENGKNLKVEFIINGEKKILDFCDLSTGEKNLIAMYILIFFFLRNGYSLFIDGVDKCISMDEIQPFLSTIEDSMENDAQVILTSNNPGTMDFFNPEQVVFFSKMDNGMTKIFFPSVSGNEPFTVSELISRGLLEE